MYFVIRNVSYKHNSGWERIVIIIPNQYNYIDSFCEFCVNFVKVSKVKLTNDASTVSKCSAVSKNYFKDDFIEEFVEKKKSRASLIHLGYYTRAVIINKLITNFIEFVKQQKFLKFQIISCGSGFDTTYWRLSHENLLNKSVFIEIDFPDVIKRKILLIQQSQKLRSLLQETSYNPILPGVHKMNFNYFLFEADLSDLNLIEHLFSDVNIDYDILTLFLSECVVTYMKESDSSNLIKWMSQKFKNCTFLNYEQIHPDDGFGQVMLNHFGKLQSSLFSVAKYPNCDSHYLRYKSLGFQNSYCISEWDALIWLTAEDERKRALSLELFDEFEEFHLKCIHYVVAIAGNGVLSDWISEFPPITNVNNDIVYKEKLRADRFDCDLQLFRHSSCTLNNNIFFFGGCTKRSRSIKIYKINKKVPSEIKELENLGNSDIQFDMVFGTAVGFELNTVSFLFLFGGRTSPNKVWNNGLPVLIELNDNKCIPRVIFYENSPISRYRSPMVCLNSDESEVHCWIFGGRTIDLNHPLSDFWELKIKHDSTENLTYTWKQHKNNAKNWPCSRMSHSLTACPKRFELFMFGGLNFNSSSALNDMWKWCCRSESWKKVQLTGNALPRYSHTAHLKDDFLYLVGGVNMLAGIQPGLGIIDLKNLTIMECAIVSEVQKPLLLFNHSSELISEGDDTHIYIFGGGGNCFSFGTYVNQFGHLINLNQKSCS